MNYQVFPEQEGMAAGLTLADGSTWGIAAGDDEAPAIVSRLVEAMQLRPHDAPAYRLVILIDGDSAYADPAHAGPTPWAFMHSDNGDPFICVVPPVHNSDMLADQLLQISLVIAHQAQIRGGVLLHGALAERDGWGVILAGPGGVGKTTASQRFPAPWRSLCDDATLVVRDGNGTYWAHPWPTWSNLMSGGLGGTWDVSHAVPLKGIFFLVQAQHDGVEPIGAGGSVCLLVELAEQTSWSMSHGLGKDETRAIHLQRFKNICALAKTVACYRLYLNLTGTFWEEIERIITVKGNNTI